MPGCVQNDLIHAQETRQEGNGIAQKCIFIFFKLGKLVRRLSLASSLKIARGRFLLFRKY
jgi:hypothetical protein